MEGTINWGYVTSSPVETDAHLGNEAQGQAPIQTLDPSHQVETLEDFWVSDLNLPQRNINTASISPALNQIVYSQTAQQDGIYPHQSQQMSNYQQDQTADLLPPPYPKQTAAFSIDRDPSIETDTKNCLLDENFIADVNKELIPLTSAECLFSKNSEFYQADGANSGSPYNCTVCGKSYADRSRFRTHLASHFKEKPYECSICKKSFTRSDHLNAHMTTHSDEKTHQCATCQRMFKLKTTLIAHMKTHEGTKTHQCPICSKLFSEKSNLKVHMKLHNEEKDYQCEHCEKRFSLKGNLTKHMAIHTGAKNYICPKCKKTFSFKSCLTAHSKTHQNKQ